MEVKKDLIKRIKERILVNQSYYPYYISNFFDKIFHMHDIVEYKHLNEILDDKYFRLYTDLSEDILVSILDQAIKDSENFQKDESDKKSVRFVAEKAYEFYTSDIGKEGKYIVIKEIIDVFALCGSLNLEKNICNIDENILNKLIYFRENKDTIIFKDVELNVLKEILEQVKRYYEEIYIVENMLNSYIKIK